MEPVGCAIEERNFLVIRARIQESEVVGSASGLGTSTLCSLGKHAASFVPWLSHLQSGAEEIIQPHKLHVLIKGHFHDTLRSLLLEDGFSQAHNSNAFEISCHKHLQTRWPRFLGPHMGI